MQFGRSVCRPWSSRTSRGPRTSGRRIGLHGFVVLPAVNTFGSEEQKENYLIPGIQGEKIGALAVTEPDAGSDVAGIRTNAIRDENEFVINGSKVFITNGVRADFYIVACKTDPEKGHKGISEIIVDKGTPGFTVSRKLDKLGWWTSDTAELAFEDTRVPVSDLMGCENNGFNQIMHGFHPERLSMAVGSVASAQYCFDLTLRFVKERQTFGRSIDTFQVNRHKLADILMWIELARRLTYHAVWLYINGLECEKEIAMCKIFACEKAVEIAGICMEIYGDSGYMINNEVQRIWRDQRSQPIGGGTSEIQKEIIGKLLGF